MPKRPPNLPDSELEVIKVLWELTSATVREVLQHLQKAGRQWSYATVATLLDRLESKGMAASDRSELAYVYRALMTEAEVRQKRVGSLVEKLYDGQPGLLVLHLLKSHPLEPSETIEVRRMLDAMTGSEPEPPPKRGQRSSGAGSS